MSGPLTLRLAATASNWRLFMVRKTDPAFQKFAMRAFQRDNYTCQFCGFQAEHLQEIVNADADYRNNRLENLITACGFCTQCFFLEAVGKSDFGGGTLIYLPEMSQAELNALTHILFTTMASGNTIDDVNAKNTYRSLRLRSQIVEKELGEGFSNPALYGHLLVDAQMESERKHSINQSLSANLRLLPDLSRFAGHVEIWLLDALKACSQ